MTSNLIPSIQVSSSALQAERTRLDVIATNIAQSNTTKDINGSPYRRKEVIFESFMPTDGSAQGSAGATPQVKVSKVVEDPKPFQKIYMPNHPHADKDGMVSMPNVEIMSEMVDMITASRSFEANLQVISTARQMFSQSMRIAQ
ncbi:MAG: flagellar basal body rod protein FlgC [Verrucomicrobiota bacterium]